ncbi:MAG: DUF5069 domain-containing protein [Verrucomicrobiota bacterium]
MSNSTPISAGSQTPCCPYTQVGGIVYFPRMLSKIRFKNEGTLHPDFHEKMGNAFDAVCCRFLGIDYCALKERVLSGGSDEEVLQWVFSQSKKPSDEQIQIWNSYMLKRGWRDEESGATKRLEEFKAASGLAHRSDILTFFDYFEVDEKRKP